MLGFEYLTPANDASGNTDYTGTTYYYEKNIFGDVVAIYDENGTKVGAYGFNSFGQNNVVTNLTDDDIASLNPIRYRSYYYDTDIYLYYLQSRYYDPVTCRFINADYSINANGDVLGFNMFAYCSNNPVMFADPNGESIIAIVAIIAVCGVIGGLNGAINAASTNGNVVEGAIIGCLTGMIGSVCALTMPAPAAIAIATVAGGIVDYGMQAVFQYIETGSFDPKKVNIKQCIKTGLLTGISTAIPEFDQGANNAIDAFATALMWAEGSTLITFGDIAITNTIYSKSLNNDERQEHEDIIEIFP